MGPGRRAMLPAVVVGAAALVGACGRVGFDEAVPGAGAPLVVRPAYPEAPRWNDWIHADHPADAVFSQEGSPCAGTEDGYGGCLHAGELRRVPTALPGCAGLEVRDTLGAFQWTCAEDAEGRAVLYSTGLRPGRGLRHLVVADRWREDAVEVWQNGGLLAASEPAVWWDNPVVPAPANEAAGSASLAEEGTIYTVAASAASDGYVLAADRLALVVLEGATLSYAATGAPTCDDLFTQPQHCLVNAVRRRFLWLEGDYEASRSAEDGILLAGTSFSRLRGLRVASAGYAAIAVMSDCRSVGLLDVTAVNAGTYGIQLEGSFNVIVGATAAGNGHDNGSNAGAAGILAGYGGNVVSRLLASHNDLYGVLLWISDRSTAAHITAGNNFFGGVAAGSGQDDVIAQVVAANHLAGPGAEMASLGGHVAQIASAHNLRGLQVDVSDATLAFAVQLGDNTFDCYVMGTPIDCATLGGDAVLTSGLDLSTALMGPVSADDPANASDDAGLAARDAVQDWLGFDNAYRAWGADGAWPGAASVCTSTCRIWDWRRSGADPSLDARGPGAEPSGDPFVPGAPCPVRLDGDAAVDGADGRPFLLAAFELLGDGLGDDDGLCQAGERCLDAPSLGAAREEPMSWSAERCVFRDGRVAGVDVRQPLP